MGRGDEEKRRMEWIEGKREEMRKKMNGEGRRKGRTNGEREDREETNGEERKKGTNWGEGKSGINE